VSQLEQLLRASLRLHESDKVQDDLSLDEARKWLVRIGSAAERGDLDSARMDERMLFLKTLRAIAAGCKDPQRLASVAILATELRFEREDV
jgi:hypothetical protein